MVELAGIPLLARQRQVLRQAGIGDITVVAGHRADVIPAEGDRIIVNPAYQRTNMVATLFCAREIMTDEEDLLISYGDIVYEPRVLEAVASVAAPVSVAVDVAWRRYWELRMTDPLRDAETLKLDAAGRITEIGKKPRNYAEIEGQYLGLIKVAREQVGLLREAYEALDRNALYDGQDFDNMYMTSLLQHLIDQGWDIRAATTINGWLEVDTLEDLTLYERMHAEGSLAPFYRPEEA